MEPSVRADSLATIRSRDASASRRSPFSLRLCIFAALPLADYFLMPLVYPAAWLLKAIRRAGIHRLPQCKKVLLRVGVFPIRDHFYEPQFDCRSLRMPLSQDRDLPGIDLNTAEQLDIISSFSYAAELAHVPSEKTGALTFYMNNDKFSSGDAEYFYQFLRAIKPRRLFEIGSGNSTLMAIMALKKNSAENDSYQCQHICVEPYEMPWLEATGVTVVRKKVEDLGATFFSGLEANDILFIDSSHMIRPQGDVLFEFLELLPTLRKGVIVHIHDIFSPKNYFQSWEQGRVRFWNEQYLLEAFLSQNPSWKIIGALNYLRHNHFDALKAVAPSLTTAHEPGSFYIQRVA